MKFHEISSRWEPCIYVMGTSSNWALHVVPDQFGHFMYLVPGHFIQEAIYGLRYHYSVHVPEAGRAHRVIVSEISTSLCRPTMQQKGPDEGGAV